MKHFVERARARSQRGAVAVEMALVAPLLILFLIGSLQVGLVVIGHTAATNAAREGVRTASIHYECADQNTGTQCSATPTTNLALIQSKVFAQLNDLVQTSTVTVSVRCRHGGASGAVINCDRASVKPDEDIVEVTVNYRHIGGTPFVADNQHTAVARAVILGSPT